MSEMNVYGGKRLQRTRNGRMLAGVCSGIGEYVGIDPNILRLAFAIATFFGGLGIGAYAVAWILIPEEGAPTSIAQNILEKQKDSHLWHDMRLKFEGFQRNFSQPGRPDGQQATYTRTGADGSEGPRG
ncbi:PspC domain-containing protein [Thermobispora bispora]|uniref:Phage shock protein C, PspC n=1 Tax=Thermobispora bispora (strain ATCC 19993 / DSM 43833 / CBS 139.67 / JCM 10125 / KCTC 9307 / NBRC 14880 / R51) TaxID=469371 RepID=D6Y9M5_THEBD|nr:PspC domain-containing protein [Thermobispora bispora]ADG90056.1 phage shock protein C, PspC [Thermobispora bispora DSM 43833]MDI9580608.1 PspC domain-containing protein [Thermobispora sp.]